MGYSTDFDGSFELDKTLTEEHRAYLAAFNDTRRMKRDAAIAESMPDPVRIVAGLPIGSDGGYFVGLPDDFGQFMDASILAYNDAPHGQPGLWCQWRPNDDGTAIEWDEGEKFYNYTEWLDYLLEHFLVPWGYVLNGEVTWQGDERNDIGMIVVVDNVVEIKEGRIVYD